MSPSQPGQAHGGQPGQAHGETHGETRGRPLATYDTGSPARRRAVTITLVALGCAVGLGWLAWSASYFANPVAHVTLIGYQVLDDAHVSVRYMVTRDPAVTLRCTLQAQDSEHAPVGQVSVTVPAGQPGTVTRIDTVRTTALAVTGFVVGCAKSG